MSHYVHHVKGRLRIKTLVLRRNEQAAGRLRAMVAMHREITDCEINTLTGSVVLTYDSQLTSGEELMRLMQEHGYTSAAVAPQARTPAANGAVLDQIGANVSKVVAGFVVERAAMALIGAIL